MIIKIMRRSDFSLEFPYSSVFGVIRTSIQKCLGAKIRKDLVFILVAWINIKSIKMIFELDFLLHLRI